eukprot:m.5955 g.5955  ORF g.5955 m.5955 type:complete len:69 (-) comp5112_c0_seq1:69-275(-)
MQVCKQTSNLSFVLDSNQLAQSTWATMRARVRFPSSSLPFALHARSLSIYLSISYTRPHRQTLFSLLH